MKCTTHARCPLCLGASNMKTFDVKGHSTVEIEWECPFCGAIFETFASKYEVDRKKMEISFSGVQSVIRIKYSADDDPGQTPMELNPSRRDDD